MAGRKDLVTFDRDLLNANLRPLVDFECHGNRVRRNVFGCRLNRGVLVTLLGQHHLDNRFGFPYLGGIVRGFLADAGLFFPQFVEDLGVCDGFQAIIFHAPNQLLFPDPEYDDLADFPLIFLDSDIIEMPEGIERFDIPADDVWVELVVWLRLKVVLDRVRRNPAIAGDTDFFDAIWIRSLQRLRLYSCKNESQQHCNGHHALLQAREFYYKWRDLDWIAGILLREIRGIL